MVSDIPVQDIRLSVSFDGYSWHASDMEGNSIALQTTDEQWLPVLPDGSICEILLLPIEMLLLRPFKLPLANPRLVDAGILGQELDDRAGIEPADWWLAWQADTPVDAGSLQVAGIVFGLPMAWKREIESAPAWQSARLIGIDAWMRVSAHFPDTIEQGSNVAVFDADREGLCFGLKLDGAWRGMRRVNWGASGLTEPASADLAEDIRNSLHAMGWQDEDVAAGRLPESLHAKLALPGWQGDVVHLPDLPSRHEANLACRSESGLNFRHSSWRARSRLSQLRPWRRSMALAVALVVCWMGGMAWQNYQMNHQIEVNQQRIIAAFHKGLPDETVIIDALAQLRKATGNGAGTGGNDAAIWLRQLADINKVYRQIPWQIGELSFNDGRMAMSGQAKDLQTMNRIRKALQQETGKEVKLEDTDLNGSQVKFRLSWS